MQFIVDKIPSKIFLFTARLPLLVIPCRKATNSAVPGARQSTTDSAQHTYFMFNKIFNRMPISHSRQV